MVTCCRGVILDHTTLLGMNHPTLRLIGYILPLRKDGRGEMSHSVAKTLRSGHIVKRGAAALHHVRKIMCLLKIKLH